MEISLSNLAVEDWFRLGLIGLLALVGFGVYALHRELRSFRHLKSRPVKLKTTEQQRQRWRQSGTSRELIDLLDDVETLLKHLDSR